MDSECPVGWKELECEDCDNKHGIEFSTGDGDEPQSVILCGTCSGGWKGYVAQRYSWDCDLDECFGDAYCQECGSYNLSELRMPVDIMHCGAAHVLCLKCIKNKYHDEPSASSTTSASSDELESEAEMTEETEAVDVVEVNTEETPFPTGKFTEDEYAQLYSKSNA